MVFKPKKEQKVVNEETENLDKLSIAELRKRLKEEEERMNEVQENEEEPVDEEDSNDIDDIEDEEPEEDIPKKNKTKQEEKKRVNLTPGEIVAAIEFNINQASNLLQLLK